MMVEEGVAASGVRECFLFAYTALLLLQASSVQMGDTLFCFSGGRIWSVFGKCKHEQRDEM
jgi:hypothetical protein